jgi:hypothetical protein
MKWNITYSAVIAPSSAVAPYRLRMFPVHTFATHALRSSLSHCTISRTSHDLGELHTIIPNSLSHSSPQPRQCQSNARVANVLVDSDTVRRVLCSGGRGSRRPQRPTHIVTTKPQQQRIQSTRPATPSWRQRYQFRKD